MLWLVSKNVETENQQLSRHTDLKVVVIAPSTLEGTAAQAEQFQADIFILKHAEEDLDAARVIHDGEAWLPRTLVAEMLNHFSTEFYSSDMV
jgi:DNA-binding NarL/FixJ family response regulator